MDEPTLSEAADVNGTAAIGTTEDLESGAQRGTWSTGAAHAPAGTEALTPSFLAGLAAAMRAAAVKERERISGVVATDATTHVEKVRARAAIETDELRRLAEEDVQHIEQWSAAEIERIRGEEARKIEDRRSSLEEYLTQHNSIIETEIEGVEDAVRDYEATLERFFNELSEETDPSSIVRRAGQLPSPPDLDEIRATARANAMARYAEPEPGTTAASIGVAASGSTVADATDAPVGTLSDASEAPATEASMAADAPTGGVDSGALSGVMDDGAGSVEPAELMEPLQEPIVSEDTSATSVGSEAEASPTPAEPAPPVPEPVAVMDPDAQRAPSWPEPAPSAEPAEIAPTIEHASAAVRLLRSVAPWTAPTHAGGESQSESE